MELTVSSRKGNADKGRASKVVSAIWIPDRTEFIVAVEGQGAGVRRVSVTKAASKNEEGVEHQTSSLSCQTTVNRALQPTPSRLERLINPYASPGDQHQRAEVIVGYGTFSVRILDPYSLDDLALVELKSPPRCVSFLNADGALLVAGVGGDLVLLQAPDSTDSESNTSSTGGGKSPSQAPPQELNTYFSPVSAIVPVGPNIAWVVGGSNCCRLELDPATSIAAIALAQTIAVTEPIAAATRAPLAKVGGTSLFCFGDRVILHIQPSLDPSKPTATIIQSLELSEPISAVFPAPTMQAPPAGAPYPASGGYICTASGQLVSVHVTAGDDGKRDFRLGEFQELPFTEQLEDSRNPNGTGGESGFPIGVNINPVPSRGAEQGLPMPEDVFVHATIVYQDKVVVFPAGNLIAPLGVPPSIAVAAEEQQQPSAAPASEDDAERIFSVTLTSTAPDEFRAYLDEQLNATKKDSVSSNSNRPPVAITLSLDTADLEQCAPLMNVSTKVKLVGEGPEEVVFMALPYQASISKIQQLLEERFDRRVVISFEVVTHAVVQNPLVQPRGARSSTPTGDPSGKVRKLLELRSANIKVFHAMEPEDRLLVCRSLFPQVSRSRAQTPALPGIRSQTPGNSHNFSASLSGSGVMNDNSGIQRPGTSLSSTQERSMVERLYADCERGRALKLLQLEQKFFPTLKEKPISKKEESALLERVTTGFMKSKTQAREKVVHQFEKEGYIRPPPKRPDVDEEQAIIQKFYYERLKKEKVREEQLNARLFKPKPVIKLKSAEDWKQWQEHRAKDIKKEFRLRDQFY